LSKCRILRLDLLDDSRSSAFSLNEKTFILESGLYLMGLHLASTTSAAWFVGECYPNHLQRQFVRKSGFSGPPSGRRFPEARGVVLPSFALIRNFQFRAVPRDLHMGYH
jgi:hypothetical protein